MGRIARSAHASWQGTVAEGGGRIGLDSGAYEGPFTLKARIDERRERDQPRGADRGRRRWVLHDVACEPARGAGHASGRHPDQRPRAARTEARGIPDHAHHACRPSGTSRASTRRGSSSWPSRPRPRVRSRSRSRGPRSSSMHPSNRSTPHRACLWSADVKGCADAARRPWPGPFCSPGSRAPETKVTTRGRPPAPHPRAGTSTRTYSSGDANPMKVRLILVAVALTALIAAGCGSSSSNNSSSSASSGEAAHSSSDQRLERRVDEALQCLDRDRRTVHRSGR